MKFSGIIIGIIGGALFVWHLGKVLTGNDQGQPPFTHHTISLLGGVLLFAGVWLYAAGRKRGRRSTGTNDR